MDNWPMLDFIPEGANGSGILVVWLETTKRSIVVVQGKLAGGVRGLVTEFIATSIFGATAQRKDKSIFG